MRSDTVAEADEVSKSTTGAIDVAFEFMRQWPTRRMHLWFKRTDPNTGVESVSVGRTYLRTEAGYAAMRDAIQKAQGQFNIYYSVNEPDDSVTFNRVGKASNAQIKQVVALHVDVDPKDGETQADAVGRIGSLLGNYSPVPSYIVASGGGAQGLWVLDKPIVLDGTSPDEMKRYNRKIASDVGGDSACDVSRVLRLPGTWNLPNESKRARGRVPSMARVLAQSGASYPIFTFGKAPEIATIKSIDGDDAPLRWDQMPSISDPNIDEWPNRAALIATYAMQGISLEQLNAVVSELDPGAKPYGKWADGTMAFAASMKTSGRSREEIAAIMMWVLRRSRYAVGVKPSRLRRAIERAITRSVEAEAAGPLTDNAIAKMFDAPSRPYVDPVASMFGGAA